MALVSTVTIFRPKYDLIRSFTFFAVVEKGQTPPSEHTMTEYSEQIVEELVEVTKHFAGDDQPPEDIAVALFECFEAMQKFNFDGMHYRHQSSYCTMTSFSLQILFTKGIAQRILEKTRLYLDDISMKSNIDSNPTVNKCYKHIDILARRRQEYRGQESASAHYGQATNGNGYNLCVNSSTYTR